MSKTDLNVAQLNCYQSPKISVITLEIEQTILEGSVTPGGFSPGFGFGEGGETPIG